MTLRHLRIFIEVYQQGTVTGAAKALNMTQPTVTRAIQELEDYYECQFFERIHRRLYVTDAGRALYAQAVHAVSAIDGIKKNLSGWDERGVLKVGAGMTLGSMLLPRVLSEFKKRHPALTLHAVVTDREKLEQMLARNQIDLALIEGSLRDDSLKREFLGRDRMVLILPRKHPLCQKDSLSIEDIAGEDFVVTEEGSASRAFLEHLFSFHDRQLRPVMESGSIPAVIQAVRAGIGLALVPQQLLILNGMNESVCEKNLPYEALVRKNQIVWVEKKYLGKSLLEFIELTKEYASPVLF